MEPNFVKGKYPKFILLKNAKLQPKNVNLIVHGQGVFIFKNLENSKPCSFQLLNDDKTDGFDVDFTLEAVMVKRISTTEPFINEKTTGITNGLINENGAYYWFSIHAQNQQFSAGIGEPRLETLTYKYSFSFNDDDLRKANKLLLESLTSIHISENSTSLVQLELLRDPIVGNIPQIVKDKDEITMDDMATGKYLPKSVLSPSAQMLYDCIAGKYFQLNTPEFPDFSNAIEHSIITEGLWCNKRLKEKSTEFNTKPNYNETYLRITLGQNNGNSPGIPYVLEIWPIGHFSPIHSHAKANAIIRVLNGTINVNLYPFLGIN